jgi:glycosyltransferase involved in cell wall biosynthesis
MNDRPLVSLVVPAYNVERYVGEALESALAQTYRPLEIVVVDDGSTDSTAAVVRRYGDHPELVYVRQDNRGLSGARNRGVELARGEMIGLLDADDVWMPEKVERCVSLLTEHPDVGWVTTDCYLLRETQRTTERYYGVFVEDSFPVGRSAQLAAIATRNYMSVACIIRRDLFDRFGWFDTSLRSSEDYDLWIRFLLGGSSVARIEEPLGWYRLRGDSLSADPGPQWETHLTVLERYIPELWHRGAKAPARECYDIARRLGRSGRRREVLRYAYMALRAPDLSLADRAKFSFGSARQVMQPRHRVRQRSSAS